MNDVLQYGVPRPDMFEAPSAWLTRLVAVQGCSLGEMLSFLDLDTRHDIDWRLAGQGFSEFRRRCGLAPHDFAVAELLLSNMRRASLDPVRYLLHGDHPRQARFRFCPICLSQRREAHFDIHWRFADWRLCPIHDCLMEEACPRCADPLMHPRSMVASRAGRDGHCSLRRCLQCSARLTDAQPCPISADSFSLLREREHCWLKNGRALLAALIHGRFTLGDEIISLERLGLVDLKGGLPTAAEWWRVQRRLRSQLKPQIHRRRHRTRNVRSSTPSGKLKTSPHTSMTRRKERHAK